MVAATLPGVIGLVYDADRASLRSILNQLEHSLAGRRAESVGVFTPGKLGFMSLTRHVSVSGAELQTEFWVQLCGMMLEPALGGRVDLFSCLGVSTINQELGMDIVYRLTGLTTVPFNAPLGGIFGKWEEICGAWLIHPDHSHPLTLYLSEDKVRNWVRFGTQLEELATEIRQRYRDRLQVQHTTGLHEVIDSVICQGAQLRLDLSEVLQYTVSKLQIESTHNSESTRKGVLCMKLVEILLSCEFVKRLEQEQGDTSSVKSGSESDLMTTGQDTLTLLQWEGRWVGDRVRLGSPSHQFPRGIVVERRLLLLQELVRTERQFYRSLVSIETQLYQPLHEASSNDKPVLNPAHIRTCFSDLLEIRKVHAVFLERAEKKLSGWTEQQCIGDILLTLARRFDCYSNYVNNYPSVIAIFKKNMNDNPAFWGFVERFTRRHNNKAELFDLISQPMCRIETLKTIVSSLIFFTPNQHPDLQLLKQCDQEYSALCGTIAKSRQQYRDLAQLSSIESRVVNCPLLTDQKRDLLTTVQVYRVKSKVDASGTPHVFGQDARFPHYSKYRLFLFEDSVMITRKSYSVLPYQTSPGEVDTFVGAFALAATRVKLAEGARRFVLYTSGSSFLFECETEARMGEWVEAVNRAIQGAPKLLLPNVYVTELRTS